MPETVVGRYRVEGKIGEGGMGEVLAAYDEKLQRRVVLKSIRDDRRTGELARRRFRREAQILSQLDHPSICRIFDLVETGDEDYLVLEHIEGATLADLLPRGVERESALGIAAGILDALVVAHAAGVVHRDLKPGNVMITPGDEVKVLDFGLAHLTTMDEPAGDGALGAPSETTPPEDSAWDSETTDRTLGLRTEVGTISGTLLYMSPEQASGEAVGPASDMYSLGLLFQELFTGRQPHPAHLNPQQLFACAQEGRSLPVSGLDADLTRWIEGMKATSPTMRPTAREAADRLNWMRGKPRRRLVRAGVAAGALLALAGGTKYTLDLRHQRRIAEERRNAAILDRQRAETLIEFMIGDLNEKLHREGGRLDLLDDSHRMALDYFAAVDEDDLTESELVARCELLGRISNTRSAQGQFAEALEFSRESVRQAEALHRRRPDDPEAIANLSNSVFYLGLAHFSLEQFEEAVRQYERYRELSEQLLAREPDNREWQAEVAYAWLNLGAVHSSAGDGPRALAEMAEALAIWDRMLERAPSDVELLSEKAEVQSWIASTLVSLERELEAVPVLTEELGLRERIYEANGRAPFDAERLAVCRFYLGKALLAGDPAQAAHHLGLASELMAELHGHDEANTEWAHQLARSWSLLGQASARRGDVEEARSVWQRSAELLGELLGKDPANEAWGEARRDVLSRLDSLPAATIR